jgi:hypothetical protein
MRWILTRDPVTQKERRDTWIGPSSTPIQIVSTVGSTRVLLFG